MVNAITARWPWIDHGLFPTREALIAWIKRNSCLFVALIIIVLSLTLPFQPEHPHDFHRSETDTQTLLQATSSGHNPTVTITVRANIGQQTVN
jgi:hypothetical protein